MADLLSSDGDHRDTEQVTQPSHHLRMLCGCAHCPACVMTPRKEAVKLTNTTATDSPGHVVPKVLKLRSRINADAIS